MDTSKIKDFWSIQKSTKISDKPENLKTLEELEDIVDSLKNKRKKIVFTNGCFDILHKGHVKILKEMKELGDVLIVALNSDSSVRNFKGEGRPINNEIDRAFVIGNIKGVDYVVIFDENDPLNILRRLKPDVHVKGGNPIPERVSMEKEIVESYGGKLICLDLVDGYSTTEIMERMKSG